MLREFGRRIHGEEMEKLVDTARQLQSRLQEEIATSPPELVYATFVGRNEHMRDRPRECRRRCNVGGVGMDLQALGFEHAEASWGAGQPAFDPALLLKPVRVSAPGTKFAPA